MYIFFLFVSAGLTYQERVWTLPELSVQLWLPTTGPTTGCTGWDPSVEEWWPRRCSGKRSSSWLSVGWTNERTGVTAAVSLCLSSLSGSSSVIISYESLWNHNNFAESYKVMWSVWWYCCCFLSRMSVYVMGGCFISV